MMTCTCDLKDCNNPVKDTRKIYICRQNPMDLYFRFHLCYKCLKNLKNYISDKLSDNTKQSFEQVSDTAEKIYNTDNDKPF